MEYSKSRKRFLAEDIIDSPEPMLTETDIEDIVTPASQYKLHIPDRRLHKQSRASLFGGKRPADDPVADESPMTKKIRRDLEGLTLSETKPENKTQIKNVVERLVTEDDLVADGSREHILPTIPGRHSDLKSISAQTMSDVMNGKYDSEYSRVTIVDCRYPYEYEGGHIRGAINLYTKDEVYSLLKQNVATDKPHILIFHCEFSSERGPKMYRFLRSEDRQLNKESYPKLNYPEVYLLHGGYKEFFTHRQEQCEPVTYKPMLHADHGDDLRHFRRKSKSWTAGETESKKRRSAARKPRLSLEF